jgi:hypothetical protein
MIVRRPLLKGEKWRTPSCFVSGFKDVAHPADADIEMTKGEAFPAILRLRERSYRKPIE